MDTLSRRDVIRGAGILGGAAALAPLLAACGESHGGRNRAGPAPAGAGYVSADVVRASGSRSAGRTAAAALGELAMDLYGELATPGANLVLSPWSVGVALAMARAGARGRTRREMDDVLHAGPATLDPGLCWLDRQLHSRTGQQENSTGKSGTVALETADSLWGQRDTAWQPAFLRTLARDFGAGMRVVDFRRHADDATGAINAWTADRTHDRIKELIPRGTLDRATRLVLVDAIWFKAPWFHAFEKELTRRAPFHRADGSTVPAEMMSGVVDAAGYARGDGWQAVRIPYAGQELAMTIVVPDDPSGLPRAERSLAGAGLTRMLGSLEPHAVDLRLPKWTFRTHAPLGGPLAELGMPTAFTDAADFTGMTEQERLRIQAVLHEAFVAVDEEGTEAAAATAVVMRATSAPVTRPVAADRPFCFVIHDVATRTPLFFGRVADPTA